jgi:hypothetical protein
MLDYQGGLIPSYYLPLQTTNPSCSYGKENPQQENERPSLTSWRRRLMTPLPLLLDPPQVPRCEISLKRRKTGEVQRHQRTRDAVLTEPVAVSAARHHRRVVLKTGPTLSWSRSVPHLPYLLIANPLPSSYSNLRGTPGYWEAIDLSTTMFRRYPRYPWRTTMDG